MPPRGGRRALARSGALVGRSAARAPRRQAPAGVRTRGPAVRGRAGAQRSCRVASRHPAPGAGAPGLSSSPSPLHGPDEAGQDQLIELGLLPLAVGRLTLARLVRLVPEVRQVVELLDLGARPVELDVLR